jgi:hypothetical protein
MKQVKRGLRKGYPILRLYEPDVENIKFLPRDDEPLWIDSLLF